MKFASIHGKGGATVQITTSISLQQGQTKGGAKERLFATKTDCRGERVASSMVAGKMGG